MNELIISGGQLACAYIPKLFTFWGRTVSASLTAEIGQGLLVRIKAPIRRGSHTYTQNSVYYEHLFKRNLQQHRQSPCPFPSQMRKATVIPHSTHQHCSLLSVQTSSSVSWVQSSTCLDIISITGGDLVIIKCAVCLDIHHPYHRYSLLFVQASSIHWYSLLSSSVLSVQTSSPVFCLSRNHHVCTLLCVQTSSLSLVQPAVQASSSVLSVQTSSSVSQVQPSVCLKMICIIGVACFLPRHHLHCWYSLLSMHHHL